MTREMGMRRLARRAAVAALVAGFMVVPAAPSASAQPAGIATHTTLTTQPRQIGGRIITAYFATVLGEDGTPAKGLVQLQEQGRIVAGAALNSSGEAEILAGGLGVGDHILRAVYSGDATRAGSQSEAVVAHRDAAASSAPGFSLAISPGALPASGQSLAPGDSGNVTATVTSLNGFTGFVSLSCAGAPVSPGSYTDTAMPVGVTCVFTPENVQITSAIANSANPTVVSYLAVQTTAPAGQNAHNRPPNGVRSGGTGGPLGLAVLLPGVIGLGLLRRKRNVLSRVALVVLMGTVSLLGATACNARYKYLNHPPTANEGTPAGNYTLTVWAQTSNGVTASEQFTTLGLTVN